MNVAKKRSGLPSPRQRLACVTDVPTLSPSGCSSTPDTEPTSGAGTKRGLKKVSLPKPARGLSCAYIFVSRIKDRQCYQIKRCEDQANLFCPASGTVLCS